MNRLRRTLISQMVLSPWLTAVPRAALSAVPVRIVVPYAAGSPTDVGVRQLVDAMRKQGGRNYLVDNRPGAGGTIGSAEVARAKPDGNTLLATTGGHVTNPAFYAKLPFDTARDFTPIALITSSPGFVLLVPAKSRYDTLEQLIAAARAKPSGLSYGSAGIGNTTHLVGAMFEKSLKLELLHVPYKGNALNDLVAGQVDMVFWGSSAAYQFVRSGQLKALAITGPQRYAMLPGVPTLEERGIRDVDAPAWAGVFGPAVFFWR